MGGGRAVTANNTRPKGPGLIGARIRFFALTWMKHDNLVTNLEQRPTIYYYMSYFIQLVTCCLTLNRLQSLVIGRKINAYFSSSGIVLVSY